MGSSDSIAQPGTIGKTIIAGLPNKDELELLRSLVKVKVEIEEMKQQDKTTAGSTVEPKEFLCQHCGRKFDQSQGLGGHTSRAHPGKSDNYKQKRLVRRNREIDRLKLELAKRKYYKKLGYDYDELQKTDGGRRTLKKALDRKLLKKIKKNLTKREIDDFIDFEAINSEKSESK